MSSAASTLWIGDLEQYMDENFIMESFAMMGEPPVSVKVIRDRMTGLTRGFGFVDFGDESSALRARQNCNGKTMPNDNQSKQFRLNAANGNGQRTGGSSADYSMFVGDLSDDVDDQTLFQAFSNRFTSVKSAKVIVDSSGISRGFGFVRFEAEDEYQQALTNMQSFTGIGQKPIRVGAAQPRRNTFDQQPRGPNYFNAASAYNANSSFNPNMLFDPNSLPNAMPTAALATPTPVAALNGGNQYATQWNPAAQFGQYAAF